jgi:hypothetical protein
MPAMRWDISGQETCSLLHLKFDYQLWHKAPEFFLPSEEFIASEYGSNTFDLW